MLKSFKIFLAIISLVSNQAMGQYLKAAPMEPLETCPQVPVRNFDQNSSSTQQTETDPACLARNQAKVNKYNAGVAAVNSAGRMITSDASTLSMPVEPVNNCGSQPMSGSGNHSDYGPYQQCMQTYGAAMADYGRQMAGWNEMKKNEQVTADAKAAADKQAALSAEAAKASTLALQEARAKAQSASSTSNLASIAAMAASGYNAYIFYASCTPYCSAWGNLALSIGLAMISAQSGKQANFSDNQAYNACITQTQISSASSSGECGTPPPTTFDPSTINPATSVMTNFDSNGNCIAKDPTVCSKIKSQYPTGTNMKDVYNKLSGFASAPAFKMNPDGSVTLKNGKTLTAKDLSSIEALKAAGFTDAQSKDAVAAMAKASAKSGLDLAQKDLKSDGSKKASLDFGGVGMGTLGGSGEASGKDANGALGSRGGFGTKDVGGNDGKDRAPAGEGLTRDFNGDTIGSAGDDIFSMMNRRYKTKTAQDAFISN